jgi:hypothetical protein
MSASPLSPASANPARGETALMLGGQSYTVRPTFQALVAAEQDVGPLFALVEKAAAGQLSLLDTVSLIWHCLHDKPDAMTREALGELIAETGIGMLSPLLQSLLGQIIKGK